MPLIGIRSSQPDPNRMQSLAAYVQETYSYTGRTQVNPATAKTGSYRAFLCWGQSQGCNVGTTPHTVSNPTKQFNVSLQNGGIYQAADPLISVAGTGGSIWATLGDLLIAASSYSNVTWMPVNVGSTPIVEWRNNGVCVHRLRVAASRLLALGFTASNITIISMIGESDNLGGTSQATMQAGYTEVRSIFDSLGLASSPMYVPLESWFSGAASSTIRAAQSAVINGTTIKAGPDFDTLNNTYRGGGTDFNDTGVAAAAALWKTALGF